MAAAGSGTVVDRDGVVGAARRRVVPTLQVGWISVEEHRQFAGEDRVAPGMELPFRGLPDVAAGGHLPVIFCQMTLPLLSLSCMNAVAWKHTAGVIRLAGVTLRIRELVASLKRGDLRPFHNWRSF